ncbi:TRAP transporter large permease [Chloroflexota bacterium]
MIWASMLGILFTLLFSGVWIAVALGVAGIVIMQVWGGGIHLLSSAIWTSLNIYELTAIPIFLFMGEVILQSGISKKMYDSVSPLLARLPGKLLHSNIVMSAMFAAVFGSSAACAAAVGSVAIPELKRRKYDTKLVLGSICVGGTLGFMIPPSGQFILYGSVAQVSVAALFAAGVVPGIIMTVLFMIYLVIKGTVTPQIAPVDEKVLPIKDTIRPLLSLWPLLVLMIACVGPIYAGLATPTEAAGIGAFTSIIVGWTLGNLGWKDLWGSLRATTKIIGMLFFIMLGAMILAKAVSTLGLPRHLIDLVGGLPVSPVIVLICIYILYLILGCFFDGISLMLMTLPFASPIVIGMGFDPVWFGVFITLVIEIAVVTPPLGLNLFVVKGIAGEDTAISDVFLGSIPFLVCTIIVLGIITIFPHIVSWLPNLLNL